jgi:hypothetical protein
MAIQGSDRCQRKEFDAPGARDISIEVFDGHADAQERAASPACAFDGAGDVEAPRARGAGPLVDLIFVRSPSDTPSYGERAKQTRAIRNILKCVVNFRFNSSHSKSSSSR